MKISYLVKRFIPYFKKYKGILIFDLVCAAFTTVCELVFPMLVRFITNTAERDVSLLTPQLILKICGFYVGLRIVDALAYYYMANRGHVMGAKIETDMRRDLFSKLQEQTFSFFTRNKIGQLMSRLTSDLFDVTEFAHHCPEEFFIGGIKIIAAFTILCGINVPLTVIVFAILPVMLVFCKILNRKMRAVFAENRVQTGEINARAEDSLGGIRVVKSFANESIEREKFEKDNAKFLEIKRRSYRYMGIFQSTTRLFDGVMYITAVTAGSFFIINKSITVGDLTAYLLYIATLIASIRKIIEFTEQFQRGMTGIERFTEMMDSEVAIVDKEDAFDIGEVTGNIRFEDVDFAYEDDGKSVLTKINIDIKSGESVALVGPSGGGKTTLCNLIPRFYDTTGGTIYIDGTDIRNVTLKSLRDNIGVVQQDVYLFAGTIFENIAYGKTGATMEEVKKAAVLAGADEFIMKFDKGYDTYTGERGVRLSGGQKQRISIARVFLKNPPILILDEATSALDNESERIVQKSLERLSEGRTVFTIAHRLSTIKNAKHILVLTEDGIEEQGSHEELINKNGLYRRLYDISR